MPIFFYSSENPFRDSVPYKKNPSKVGGFTRPVPPRGMPYFATYPWWVAPQRCPLPFRLRLQRYGEYLCFPNLLC